VPVAHPLLGGRGLLMQGDRSARPARVLVGKGKVVARRQDAPGGSACVLSFSHYSHTARPKIRVQSRPTTWPHAEGREISLKAAAIANTAVNTVAKKDP
jgi:hypothetical protein